MTQSRSQAVATGVLRSGRHLLTLVLAGWLTACQSPNPLFADQPLQTGETLKLGVIVSETGPYAAVGVPILSALLLLRDTVNACGGVNRAPISLVIYDNGGDRDGPAAGLRYLVNDVGVHAIVAAFKAPVEADELAIALDKNVSLLSPTTSTTVQPQRRSSLKGWGQLSLTETQQAQALAKLAIARQWQRAALLVSDADHGQRFKRAFTHTFEALGGSIVVPSPSIDYSDSRSAASRTGTPSTPFASSPEQTEAAEVARLTALIRNTDVLVASLHDRRGYRLLKSTLQQAPGSVPVLLTHSAALPLFGESRWRRFSADEPYSLSGATGLLPGEDSDSLRSLRARLESDDALKWGEYAPQAWDAGALIVLAAEAAGRNGRPGIQTELKHVANPPGVAVTQVCEGLAQLRKGAMINYQGASGRVDLGSDGQLVVNARYRIWQLLESGRLRWGDSIMLKQSDLSE